MSYYSVSLVDEHGIELLRDTVVNNIVELTGFFLSLSGYCPDDGELRCSVEATACYHHPVVEAATLSQTACFIINPIVTKQQIKATIRGKKTDRTDALMIARLGLRGEGWRAVPEQYQTAKYCARGQLRIHQLKQALRAYATHVQDVLEDELPETVRIALNQTDVELTNLKIAFERAAAIAAPTELSGLLQTIPGVGPYVAASLLGELQGMERFNSSKALIAYAGLDPKIRQSGHTLNNTGRLTKRGSVYLRRSIFIAASQARRCDPVLKALYEHKRAEGKSYTVAVVVIARKLLTIVRAVWLRGTPYTTDLQKVLDRVI